MVISAADMTEAERPRRRRALSILAVILPILAIAGTAYWFVRTYVAPPMTAIAEPVTAPTLAQAHPMQPAETTGTSPPPATSGSIWPAVPRTPVSSVWDSVPLPGPPRQTQSLAAEPASANERIAVPLPPARPRMSAEATSGPVPMPRPRPVPTSSAN